MENTETAAQVAARATSTDPDGDRITVTLSIDVDVMVLSDGREFYGYAVGDFDFGDEALFCAHRIADYGGDSEEGWHANLNLGYKSGFGYGLTPTR